LVERILELMAKHGVKGNQLTSSIGMGHSAVSDWSKGRAKPSYGALVKIANYFDVSVEYLEGKTDNPAPKHTEVLEDNKKQQPLSNKKAAAILKALADADIAKEDEDLDEDGIKVLSDFLIANAPMLKKLMNKDG